MAIKIDSVGWGSIQVGGKQHPETLQVIIVGDEVDPWSHGRLTESFGTTHLLPGSEAGKLLEGNPEVIVIGNGWDSVFKVSEEAKKKFEGAGVEVKILDTRRAVEEYNRLVDEGKKVNALIHTTC